ncbi:MAG TPA: phosphoadenylyl-sulfate reductase [Caldilineaceae bacterium]|nr:phosphoadenylyl-sulfate reductase [Caldilineaceae bacterium]
MSTTVMSDPLNLATAAPTSPIARAATNAAPVASAAASPQGTPLHGTTSAADDFLDWTRIVFGRISNRFDHAATTDLLVWAAQTFGTGLSVGTSFGTSGIVLMDLALHVNPDVDIFYIDTGYFFPETLDLMRRLEEHYQRNFRRVSTQMTIAEQEKRFGPRLYENDPDLCCHVRKVLPMSQALRDSTAWATAVRRDQASSRRNTPLVQWNERHNVVKLAPLAHWTEADIWNHIAEQKLPYNELHDRNYPSIGCWPCTRAVQPGEDLRAGRWSGREKIECGIHWDVKQPIRAAH